MSNFQHFKCSYILLGIKYCFMRFVNHCFPAFVAILQCPNLFFELRLYFLGSSQKYVGPSEMLAVFVWFNVVGPFVILSGLNA